MQVTVSHIHDSNGLRVAVSPDSAWVRAAVERALEVPGTAAGQLHLSRTAGKVEVKGELQVTAAHPCERCGEDVPLALVAAVDLAFLPSSHAPAAHHELELEAEDLDVGYYDDDTLDVEDLVCEAIALEMPSRVVCEDREACDGRTARLLAERGAAGSPGDHPFAALKGRFH